jgi:hypothetical protein
MQAWDGVVQTLALTMGVAWASGINLYAAILVLGWLGASGSMQLPPSLEVLASPIVIVAAGFMYLVEFVADKVPGVDSGWDAVSTFVRIPAGAVLAAGVVGQVDPAVAIAAGILGGAVAATSHVTKASARLLINASPEPFTNVAASLGEDVVVVAGLWAAWSHPWAFLAALVLFSVAVALALPRLWRGIRALAARVASLLGRRTRVDA